MRSKISLISLSSFIALIGLSAFAADTAILMSDGTMATDIRGIKPPLYFPVKWWLVILCAVLIVIITGGFLAYILLKINRARPRALAALPAHEIAYKALEDLKGSGLVKQGLVKEYFFRLSFIVRQYLENRFDLRAPEMTTEEFLASMKGSDKLNELIKNMLKDFLERSDMVKFAKYGPTADEILDAFDAAKGLIDETKQAGS